ncbi:MAG: DNA primase [Bacteroidetes bacterium]|nr:DNA primase [Bacteroidota bacterium]MBU1116327.1 DNA primase [Bacteroidota bacterium]MBU1796900.1 DNA primase [Bacteroidota bacterium]
MQIPDHQIEEIRTNTDIVDLISRFVQLRKRGRNYIGLCPFHNEKTPSFTVSPDKQIYHCFGCHAGGNSFRFLMDYKNISFVESVQELADNLGIKIEENSTPNVEEKSEYEELYEINVIAAKFFSSNLLKNPKGEIARNYFKNRQIKPKTNTIFGLGFALNEWDLLLNHLKENKVNLSQAKDIGLIDTKDDGNYYDKYRGRTIFPIFSPNGRVIAFGGRVMNPDEKSAKYINSPESKIYSKRKTLYGLYHSKEEIRRLDKAILVEGYMDVISLFQNGVKNVVASSGTALTEEQVLLLSRFTKNIVVNFDADLAGQKAATRSIELLLKNGFDVKLILLPNNEDPDSYINKFGTEEFNKQVINAKDFLEFQTEQFYNAGAFDDSKKSADAIRELVKYVALIEDELKRNILIKSISKKFNLREKLIEKELDIILGLNETKEIKSEIRIGKKNLADITVLQESTESNFSFEFEKDLIKLLLEGNEEIIECILDYIHPNDFKNKTFNVIANSIETNYHKGNVTTSSIIESLEDESIKTIALSLTLGEEIISDKWNEKKDEDKIQLNHLQKAKDVVRKYRILLINAQIAKNNHQIAVTDDEDFIMELLIENKELTQQRKRILEGQGNSDLI